MLCVMCMSGLCPVAHTLVINFKSKTPALIVVCVPVRRVVGIPACNYLHRMQDTAGSTVTTASGIGTAVPVARHVHARWLNATA